MTEVLYAELAGIADARLEEVSVYLSAEDLKKNRKYRREVNRRQHLAGRLLLMKGLEQRGYEADMLRQLHILDKPFIDGLPLRFNVAHSHDLVVCALSDQEVGVDVELMDRTVRLDDFRYTMSDAQWDLIYDADDPYAAFYAFWVAKESVIKADGRGLAVSLADIMVNGETAALEGREWQVKSSWVNERYCCCVAGGELGEVRVLKVGC